MKRLDKYDKFFIAAITLSSFWAIGYYTYNSGKGSVSVGEGIGQAILLWLPLVISIGAYQIARLVKWIKNLTRRSSDQYLQRKG